MIYYYKMSTSLLSYTIVKVHKLEALKDYRGLTTRSASSFICEDLLIIQRLTYFVTSIHRHQVFKKNDFIYIQIYNTIFSYFKGIYLSKALTCMKNFLYKQELHFCQGDIYFWPHCCMNNLYISHRSLYAPTYNF